jgi:uncharacterized protein YcfJ
MTMKTRILTGALIAATAAGALAVPTFASAQTYYYDDCRAREHSNGTAGAVIGGIAGALLGSSVAPHHGNRAGGAAIGGVTGAIIGNSIGRSSAKSNSYACNGYDRRYYSYDNRGYYSGYSAPTYYYNGAYDGRYGYNTYYERPYSYDSRTYYYPY